MQNQDNHLQTLSEIKSLMERSSRFLSLSGLSGVAAGTFALIGAWAAHYYTGIPFTNEYQTRLASNDLTQFLILDFSLVLILALISGLFFTARKARRKGLKVWDKTAYRVVLNLMLPLAAGGLLCLILMFRHGEISLIAPLTLIFYGLALINASKYTLNDIRYLGILEIILGLIGAYYLNYGLLIWSIGFGVLHIIYGSVMYWKYER